MINEVRNEVLSILNKNNYGFITPTDFNNYAKLAQLDIFEQYFFKYNQFIIKQNLRQANTGLADITKRLEEVIELFSVTGNPVISTPTNSYTLPSNLYLLNRVTYVPQAGLFRDVEKCSRVKLNQLLMSNLTQPVEIFPMYYNEGSKIFIYPITIADQTKVQIDYVRYPAEPKWTWRNISGGAPLFDPTQPDYQDFELPQSDQPLLVAKILQYAGFEIREDAAVQAGLQEEQKTMQIES